nr:CPPV239 hypothetical protein [Cooks petrelpox virus]
MFNCYIRKIITGNVCKSIDLIHYRYCILIK